jgi:phospho-N-acetylmuramoyl-pentapeptide-transferase
LGIIAVLAIAVRKELLIPLLCGVFLVENLSVVIQVSYFKYTKNAYEGRSLPDGAFASSLSKEGLP